MFGFRPKDIILILCAAIFGNIVGYSILHAVKLSSETQQVVLYSPNLGLSIVHRSGVEDGKPVVYLASSMYRYLNPDGTVQGDDDLWAPKSGWTGDEFGVPITASVEKFAEKASKKETKFEIEVSE